MLSTASCLQSVRTVNPKEQHQNLQHQVHLSHIPIFDVAQDGAASLALKMQESKLNTWIISAKDHDTFSCLSQRLPAELYQPTTESSMQTGLEMY